MGPAHRGVRDAGPADRYEPLRDPLCHRRHHRVGDRQLREHDIPDDPDSLRRDGARAVHMTRRRMASEAGFTLVELLVTMVAGSVVLLALGTIMAVTLRETTRSF